MKKTLLTLSLCLAMVLTACSSGEKPGGTADTTTDTQNQVTTNPQSAPKTAFPSEPLKSIDRMEDLAGTEDIVSVEKQRISDDSDVDFAVSYKVFFESDGLKLETDFILPADYAETNKNYPVMLYLSSSGHHLTDLSAMYVRSGMIVVRFRKRGSNESEGLSDVGGNGDLGDVQKLLEICDRASFMKNSKIFAVGSGINSITVLRLLAEDTEHRISGCAVSDVISDLYSAAQFRGDYFVEMYAGLIGKTYEEAPEEYDLRSAVKFYEKLTDRPILLIHYTQVPDLSPAEQPDALYDLLKDLNNDFTYYQIDEQGSDFSGTGYQRLLSWVSRHV